MIDIFKALNDPNRLKMINVLTLYDLCVCELEVILDLSQSNVSRHLAKLKAAGIITGNKDAQWVHYHISQSFKTEHDLLLKYLVKQFEDSTEYRKDREKCTAYKKSSYNCQTITTDKDFVVKFLTK